MSEFILPAHLVEEIKAKQLPEPKGWLLLCLVPEIEDTFAGSELFKPDQLRDREELLTTVLFVLKIGPDAYKDVNKFPSGARCAEGDFIMIAPSSGQRFTMHGHKLRLINDDSVLATVQDPRAIVR